MTSSPPDRSDPRFLRALIDRAAALRREHGIASVFVGIAGREGDLLAPEFIDYVESALRVEDGVFRILRERAVLLLADVGLEDAERILERLEQDFGARFAPQHPPRIELGFVPVSDANPVSTAKEILPALFEPKRGGRPDL
jgi:GGDEF domain-containing protein